MKEEKNKRKSNKSKKKVNSVKNRIIFIVLLIIIVLVILIINRNKIFKNKNENSAKKEIDYVESLEDGIKINRSKPLNETKTIDGITFTNIQLTTKDGMTTLLADVINNSGKDTILKTVKIKLVDDDNNELVLVSGIIKALKPGESTQLNIGMTSNYIESYDIAIEF